MEKPYIQETHDQSSQALEKEKEETLKFDRMTTFQHVRIYTSESIRESRNIQETKA